jgi:hypothetical protein
MPWAISMLAATVVLSGKCQATTSSVPNVAYRPGDILYMGHDGSSVSAFTHATLTDPGVLTDISDLLAGDDWNNVRAIDVNRRGQVVLADIDGPAIFTTNLHTGGMRVMTGRSPGGLPGIVGDGPPISDMSDLTFGPDGFVYLLTAQESASGYSARQIMRVDPDSGARSIAATIEPPLGFDPSFAFAPNGDLFVTLNAVASSDGPPPTTVSAIVKVDVATGNVQRFPEAGFTYEFGIDDIAIGDGGEAVLLADGNLYELDLTTGATVWRSGYFPTGIELELTPTGTPVVLSLAHYTDGQINAVPQFVSSGETPWSGWYSVASPMPFNSPFTMALMPVPEPPTGMTVVSGMAAALSLVFARRRWATGIKSQ